MLLPAGVALLASLTGSLHCLGMCGPLRLLAAGGARSGFAYQFGRGTSYLTLGAIAGSIGASLPSWILFPLLAFLAVLSFAGVRLLPASVAKKHHQLLVWASARPFFLGLGSGLLPCGLLHGWIAAAAATGHILNGALLLGALWLGTIPALEGAATVLRKPLEKTRRRFPRAVPIAFLLLALIPIGLRLRPVVQPSAPTCHEHVH